MREIAIALIAAAAPVGAVVVTARKSARKVQEIHVLVNSRLSEALDEIDALKRDLRKEKAE
jgi:hypothetical protein